MSTPSNRVPISKQIAFINSLSTVATRVLTVGVFAWAIQYLVKRIPEDEMALLPIALSFSMVFPLLQIILTSGLSRHITEAYARGDMKQVTQIVSSQFPLLLAGAIGMLVIAQQYNNRVIYRLF